MVKKISKLDEDIDILKLSKVIWSGKFKILLSIILITLLTFVYINQKIDNYEISLKIKASDTSEFINFIPINKIFKEYSNSPINNKTIFEKYISQLMRYDDILEVLRNNDGVKNKISQLSKKEKEEVLHGIASSFKIINLDLDKSSEFIIKFNWEDKEQGIQIIKEVVDLSLMNLKKNLFRELNSTSQIVKNLMIRRDTSRVEYLLEQSAIARVLDIKDNQVDYMNLDQTQGLSLSINTNDVAYYLRGYRAIEKEIELIRARQYTNLNELKSQLLKMQNKKINWVHYFFIQTNSLNNTNLTLLLAACFGLVIGVVFVLLSNKEKI